MDDDGRGSRGPHSQGLPFGLPCSGSGREPREPHSRRFRLTRAKSRTARLLGSVCEQSSAPHGARLKPALCSAPDEREWTVVGVGRVGHTPIGSAWRPPQPLSRRLTRARSGDGRTAAAKRRRKSLARPAAPPPPPDGDGAWSAAIGDGRLRRGRDRRFYRVSGPCINSGRLRLAQRSGGRLWRWRELRRSEGGWFAAAPCSPAPGVSEYQDL